MKSMKGAGIVIPIIAAFVIFATILLFQPVRSLMAMNSMKPVMTGEVKPGILAVQTGHVNLYLMKSGGGYIMFDAGSDLNATVLALEGFGIAKSDIAAIFLTHTDVDHVAALPLLNDRDIYMAKSNQEFLAGDGSRSGAFKKMNRDFKTLDDGETVTVAGLDIQCYFTPGHTDGSASFLVDGEWLFAGDTLSLQNGKAALFNSVFNMDDREQYASITKLAMLAEREKIDTVFTMHYGYAGSESVFVGWGVPE